MILIMLLPFLVSLGAVTLSVDSLADKLFPISSEIEGAFYTSSRGESMTCLLISENVSFSYACKRLSRTLNHKTGWKKRVINSTAVSFTRKAFEFQIMAGDFSLDAGETRYRQEPILFFEQSDPHKCALLLIEPSNRPEALFEAFRLLDGRRPEPPGPHPFVFSRS